jgi:hypothetical protein
MICLRLHFYAGGVVHFGTPVDRAWAGSAGLFPDAALPTSEAGSGFGLEVNVLVTRERATLSALKRAGHLSHQLGARIKVIVPQIVPFPLQLTRPTIQPEFMARKARAIVDCSILQAEIRVCLCRRPLDAVISVLKPHSLILVGGRKRLWPTSEELLAKQIERQGHQVILITEE